MVANITNPVLLVDILTNWQSHWIFLCLLAVMTSIAIYNILLMIARAFSIRELENYAKSELLQSAANGFMAIFFLLILGGALEVAGNTIHGTINCRGESINIENTATDTSNTVMDQAYDGIRCKIQEKALALAEAQEGILDGSAGSETYNTFFLLDLQLSALGITFFQGGWVTSYYQRAERLRIANNLLTNMLITLNAQAELIRYIQNNMLGVFIPLGLLLRSFYFTRGAGALMMSIGIGFYYIFPVFYVLLDPSFVPAPPPIENTQTVQDQYCYPTMSTAVSVLTSMNSGEGGSSGLALGDVKSELSKVYSQLILHPLIAFFLTMVFVRYIMTVLGADSTDLTKMFSKVI
ncbi:MAG: hypothetical protein ABH842_04745 [Candidatus Micrarchaeota archaeon]